MALQRRYRPYQRQARTQGALRYGAEGEALDLLKRDARDDMLTTSRAQRGAADLISESAKAAGPKLGKIYEDAGLTEAVRQSLASNPAARRLAETMAAGQSELEMRQVQAREGAAFAISQAVSRYSKDVSRINERKTSLAKEKGLFTSDLLGQLIGEDRDARRAAQAEQAGRDFQADQNALGRGQSERNSIRSSGIDPDTGKPIPGGPKDKKKKPKLTLEQQNTAMDQITAAKGAYEQFAGQKGFNAKGLRNGLKVGSLPTGDKPIKLPKVSSDIYIQAGFELAKRGRLSKGTAAALKKRGMRVPGSWFTARPGSGGQVQAPGPNGQSRPG